VKTDTIFYQILQTFPSIFFELINAPPDTVNFYRFDSVEVKQLSFRIDGVFVSNLKNQPFYFVEVQFQYDASFYRRFFAEIFLYLSKASLETDWRGVVIYPNRRVESEYTQNFSELINSERLQRIYLDEIETSSVGISTIKLITVETDQAVAIAKPLIQRVNQEITDSNIKRELLELIESILIYKLPQAKREEIEAMFSLSDLKQTRFYQEALEEGKELGKEEGIQQAKLNSIPRMIQLGISLDVIAQSLDLPREIVEAETRKYQQQ